MIFISFGNWYFFAQKKTYHMVLVVWRSQPKQHPAQEIFGSFKFREVSTNSTEIGYKRFCGNLEIFIKCIVY